MTMRDSVSIVKQVTADLQDITYHPDNYPTIAPFFTDQQLVTLKNAVTILLYATRLREKGSLNPLSTEWAYRERLEDEMAHDAAHAQSEWGYIVSVAYPVDAASAEEAVRIVVEHLIEHAGEGNYRVEQYNVEGGLVGSVFIDAGTLEGQ